MLWPFDRYKILTLREGLPWQVCPCRNRMAGRRRARLDSAQQEQNQDDNQYRPDDARGSITIGVITPVGQTAKQEQN